ncbi:terminal uridylyltransferase Tailor-like [Planococcus citri]|uniref:terminal uridylyltransferase Tailor-like n=1 Tax=Planococcus citri TaxID=170843 RepID=UPI0031F76905
MDSQKIPRLQEDIISQLRLRGFKNSPKNVKTRDETISKIDFKLSTLPLSLRSPATFMEAVTLIEKEIVQKVNEISLPEYKASEILQSVTRDLKTVFGSNDIRVNGKPIVNEWEVYGSFKNGLCCNDSDIDFHNGSFENLLNSDAVDLVTKVWEVFENNANFDRVNLIKTARVPLVVLKHKRTGKECSISFSGKMGVYNSLLTKLYLEQHSSMKVLTLFLKYVLVRHDLHGTGKITTHMIFWLVVFFMQQKKLLPPVKDVRQAAVRKNYVRNWNYSVQIATRKVSRLDIQRKNPSFLYIEVFWNFIKISVS